MDHMDVAKREDLTKALDDAEIEQLPRKKGKFAQTAFVYSAEDDTFYCPAGQRMGLVRTTGDKVNRSREYGTNACLHCPLAPLCATSKTGKRRVSRSRHAKLRERTARFVQSDEGREIYRRRAPIVEGAFAVIKHHMGVRRFLLRGHDNVSTEWRWICTAYNLKKLLKAVAKSFVVRLFAPFSAAVPHSGRPLLYFRSTARSEPRRS